MSKKESSSFIAGRTYGSGWYVKKAKRAKATPTDEHRHTQERRILMPAATHQKEDRSVKGVIFIILGAVTVMCLALATGLLRP